MVDISKLPQFRNLRHLHAENMERTDKAIAAYEAYRAKPKELQPPTEQKPNVDEKTLPISSELEQRLERLEQRDNLSTEVIQSLKASLDSGNEIARGANTRSTLLIWATSISTCFLACTLAVMIWNGNTVVLRQPVEIKIISSSEFPSQPLDTCTDHPETGGNNTNSCHYNKE